VRRGPLAMLRSPRNDARPRIAFIGIVFSAAGASGGLQPRRDSLAALNAPPRARKEYVQHRLLADLRLAAGLTRQWRRQTAPPPVSRLTSSASDLPSDRKRVLP